VIKIKINRENSIAWIARPICSRFFIAFSAKIKYIIGMIMSNAKYAALFMGFLEKNMERIDNKINQ
jgi:hypothetical protein